MLYQEPPKRWKLSSRVLGIVSQKTTARNFPKLIQRPLSAAETDVVRTDEPRPNQALRL